MCATERRHRLRRGRRRVVLEDAASRAQRAAARARRDRLGRRRAELAFDSDAGTNPEVMAALHALALELTGRGAQVARIDIPPAEDGFEARPGRLPGKARRGRLRQAGAQRPAALVLDPAGALDAARAFLGAFR